MPAFDTFLTAFNHGYQDALNKESIDNNPYWTQHQDNLEPMISDYVCYQAYRKGYKEGIEE